MSCRCRELHHSTKINFKFLGLGLIQPSGHVDFYPNGGMKQPGCGGDITESIDMEDGSIVYGII